MEYTHKPVLLHECIDALAIRPDGVYVDGTLGRAGHSREIAKRLTTGRLICIDRDMAAIDAAKERLAPYLDRVTLVHSNFSELESVLRQAGVTGADGMLFELDALEPMLRSAVDGLNPGGRLAVITFHSLEDRIVKRTLQEMAKGCTCPPEFPVCVCGKKPKIKILTRRPVVSGAAELEENPRARSAKLRVAEKCDDFDL